MGRRRGSSSNTFFTAAYVAGCARSALTSQASVARILYAMGRDGILPRQVFGHVSARFFTPTLRDPGGVGGRRSGRSVDRPHHLASIVSFGALVAFSAVNLTVIKHYFIDAGERAGGGCSTTWLLPLIGFALTVWLWTNLSRLGSGGRIDLAGNRIRLAVGGDPRVPTASNT